MSHETLKPVIPGRVKDAIERLKKVRVNARNDDVCWLSRVYDPTWTGKPRVSDFRTDLQIVAYHFLDSLSE